MVGSYKKTKARKVIDDWRKKKLFIGDFRWLIEMYSEYKSYSWRTSIDSKKKLLDNIYKLYKKCWLTKNEYEKFSKYDDEVKLTIFTKQKWINIFETCFTVSRIIVPKGHLYCKDMPIYVAKVKK